MKCRCCGIPSSEFELFEGECSECYRDPESFSLIETLTYIHVVLLLLVIIFFF